MSPKGHTWTAPLNPILVRELAGGTKCARESSRFDSGADVPDGPSADPQGGIMTPIAPSPEPVTFGYRTNQTLMTDILSSNQLLLLEMLMCN
ncbi:hypothetical protein CEXT_797501 [Caerostris extrusa]|uniref:Uncharacterized protein n=1 Tax=Caerostris extrusa TaxID=172846 RepID=A0AAV4S961_CAEEX|nr:hypothetical protein CEXT_797501 [Caerostris extrusa]